MGVVALGETLKTLWNTVSNTFFTMWAYLLIRQILYIVKKNKKKTFYICLLQWRGCIFAYKAGKRGSITEVTWDTCLDTCGDRYELTGLKLSTCYRIIQDGWYNQM